LRIQIGEITEVTEGRMVIRRYERYDVGSDDEDPYGGHPADLIVDAVGLEESGGNFRFLAQSF
jgi:hypothetical protein